MRVVLAIALLLASFSGLGHEMRPAYLTLKEQKDRVIDISFRQPIVNQRFLDLEVGIDCEMLTAPVHEKSTGSLTQTWQVRCDDGLRRSTVAITGLNRTLTEVLVSVQYADGDTAQHVIKPDAPVLALAAREPPLLPVYLALGIEHLLLGLDHVLFVIAMMVLVTDKWKLVQTITAFTVAHSITLVLSTLDLIRLPQGPVEAAIALSILYVAVEITREDRTSLTTRFPWSIAFVFGLLHGLGFAGVLREIGLPQGEAAWALLLFNVGIEIGQLMVITVALSSLLVARYVLAGIRSRASWSLNPALARLAPAYVIGPVATFWVLQRVTG